MPHGTLPMIKAWIAMDVFAALLCQGLIRAVDYRRAVFGRPAGLSCLQSRVVACSDGAVPGQSLQIGVDTFILLLAGRVL